MKNIIVKKYQSDDWKNWCSGCDMNGGIFEITFRNHNHDEPVQLCEYCAKELFEQLGKVL